MHVNWIALGYIDVKLVCGGDDLCLGPCGRFDAPNHPALVRVGVFEPIHSDVNGSSDERTGKDGSSNPGANLSAL